MVVLSEGIDVAGKLTIGDVPVLIAHLIASFVMVGFLTFFVYKPFRRWSLARANKLKTDFNKTQSLLANAQEKETLAQEKLTKVKLLTKQMLSDANARSLEEKRTILQEAEMLRQQMLQETKLEINQVQKKAKKEIEQAILSNAVQLSEKLLIASLDAKKHQRLINDFLDSLNE